MMSIEEKLSWELYVNAGMAELKKQHNNCLETARKKLLEIIKGYEDYSKQKITMFSKEALEYTIKLIEQYPLKNL